jgi:RNA polymerase sigma-70 factor (ECF subfamily)
MARGIRRHLARYSHDRGGGQTRVTDELRSRMVAVLPRLRRFAYALTGSAEQGDDLVQETCLRALSRVDRWQPGTRLDSWMYRIAQNIWLDRLRANKVRGEVVDIDVVGALPGSDGRVEMDRQLTLEAVDAALGQLPAEQRAIVALVCIEGFSYKEAADITGVPIGTVMSRLARARQTLHAILDDPVPARQARATIVKTGT